MSDEHWMTRYVTNDVGQLTDYVWSYGDYGLVTDLISLLAVGGYKFCHEKLSKATAAPAVKAARGIMAILDKPVPDDAARTTLGDLWDWLDRVEREVCPQCRGSGRNDEYEVHCSLCDGDRCFVTYYPEPADADTVFIAGQPMIRNRLAWWLPGELGKEDDPVFFWGTPRAKPTSVGMVTFVGVGWELVVASLGQSEDSDTVVPGKSYRTYVPGAGQWFAQRGHFDDKAAHPGTDWFREQGFPENDLVAMWGREPEPVKEPVDV